MMEMNSKLSEIIDNYLYEVTRRLPEKQRGDIEDELRGLIEDMLIKRTSQRLADMNDLEIVLNELGQPAELADKYRDYKRYLIGPDYFDKYTDILRIVMYAVFVGAAISSLFTITWVDNLNFSDIINNVISTVISALFQAFAYVTIGFAIVERTNSGLLNKPDAKKEWSINNLVKIPNKKEIIKKVDPIVGIVFTVILMSIVNFAPHYIEVISVSDGYMSYSVFTPEVLIRLLPFLNAMFILGIIREITKLVVGRYTLSLAIVITVINVASLILVSYVFTRPGIFNPMMLEVFTNMGLLVLNGRNIFNLNNFSFFIIAVFALAFVLESCQALYKGLRYRDK